MTNQSPFEPVKHLLTRLGVYTSSPIAFLVLILYAALWYVLKPETFEWHAGATLATWAMTLVIQRAEHRDTQAIHAKLDEVLHALGDARNELTRIDEKEPEEIEVTTRTHAQGRLAMMRIIMLVAVATVIIPQSASAQGVNVGGAVRGAVIRGIPTPSDLGASSSSDRKVKRHSAAPQKLRRQR